MDAENKLGKDVELAVSSNTVGQRNLPAVQAFYGIGKDDAAANDFFEYNFNKNVVMVGNKNTTDFGIVCGVDAAINTCKTTGAPAVPDFYYSAAYKYLPATLYLRLFSDEKLDVPDKSELPVQLVTEAAKWPLDKLGELGLSPQGDFAKYVRNVFTDEMTLLFGYTAKDTGVANEKLEFTNHVVLNPVYLETAIALKQTLAATELFWASKGEVKSDALTLDVKDTNLCFSSTVSELLIVDDPTLLCDSIKAKVCKDKDNCTKDATDFSLAPIFSYTVNNYVLEFKGEEYIFYDGKGKLDCRFNDASNERSAGTCPGDSIWGLGKLAFAKYFPALTFNKEGTATLTLLNSYNFVDPPTPGRDWTWIIVGGIAMVVAVAVVLFVLLKRRNTTEDHYSSEI